MEQELASLRVNVDQLWQLVRDHEQRFDALGAGLWPSPTDSARQGTNVTAAATTWNINVGSPGASARC